MFPRRRATGVLEAFATREVDATELLEMLSLAEALQCAAAPGRWRAGMLRPPASEEELARLRDRVPAVPPALEAIYRWHYGTETAGRRSHSSMPSRR
jgi:hypothetical protein